MWPVVARTVWLVALVVALQGCASFGETSMTSKELAVAPGEPFGEVVGAITHPVGRDEPVYMRYQIDFRRVESQVGGFFVLTNTMFNSKDSYDVAGEGFRGKTFRQALPPGDYEIVNIRLSSDTGQVSMLFSSKEPFSMRFSVRPGEVVYLGRFQAHGVWGRNILKMKVADGGFFEIQDRLDEDVQLALAKGSPIEGVMVRRAELVPEDHARAFFRLED